MRVNPAKRETLSDYVMEQLKTAILEGQLKPGETLPSEKELCEKFSVGRSTIREALRALKAMGFVVRDRDGYKVQKNPADLLSDGLALKLLSQHISPTELFEARRLLEVKVAGLAAERATDEDIETDGKGG